MRLSFPPLRLGLLAGMAAVALGFAVVPTFGRGPAADAEPWLRDEDVLDRLVAARRAQIAAARTPNDRAAANLALAEVLAQAYAYGSGRARTHRAEAERRLDVAAAHLCAGDPELRLDCGQVRLWQGRLAAAAAERGFGVIWPNRAEADAASAYLTEAAGLFADAGRTDLAATAEARLADLTGA
jgi:hypothetical protein